MRDRGREAGAQLLVRRKVTLARQVDETLAPATHLVRDDERDDAALAGQEIRRERLALAEAVHCLPRAPAREQDTIGVVENDDRLAALLDERPPPDRVGVRHVTRF